MNKVITTISTKGQIVIPAPMRKIMGMGEIIKDFIMEYIPEKNGILITKAVTFKNIQDISSLFIKKGTDPIVDAHKIYESRNIQ